MAFGVSQQVPHDFSSALGKDLHGLDAMAAEPQRSFWKGGLSVWALAETILLGVFTVTLAALPVLVTRVPAPESILSMLELLHDWCTPSICFAVLIVGVLVATSRVWGSDAESLTTPEQNHKRIAEAAAGYLTPGPVDPLRMPDIFFSADAARAQQSALPLERDAAQQTSVLMPVMYAAAVSSDPPRLEEEEEEEREPAGQRFAGSRHFESKGMGDIFGEERFVGDRFSPRREGFLEESFSAESFVVAKSEDRFGPRRVEEIFLPERFVNHQAEELYMSQAQDMYHPHAEVMYGAPQGQEDLYPEMEERYVPPMHEMYPEVHDGYDSLEVGSRVETVQGKYEHEDESPGYVDSSRRNPAHFERPTRFDDDETRSPESDDEAQDLLLPPAAVEQEFKQEGIQPESVEVEAEVELQPDAELDPYESSSICFEHDSPSPVPVELPELPPSPSLRQRSTSSPTAPENPPPPMLSLPEPSDSPPDPARTRLSRRLSPRTPPRHASGRRSLSTSSSSRSYAEFVRRTSTFAPRTSIESPPKTPADPVKPVKPVLPVEPVELSELFPKGRRMNSSVILAADSSSALTKQKSMPEQGRRTRQVMVVDDAQLDKALETQGLGDDDDDVDQRVEAFLKHSREQMRLQRQESLQRHRRT